MGNPEGWTGPQEASKMAKRLIMIAALGIGLAVIGAGLFLRVDEASCQSIQSSHTDRWVTADF